MAYHGTGSSVKDTTPTVRPAARRPRRRLAGHSRRMPMPANPPARSRAESPAWSVNGIDGRRSWSRTASDRAHRGEDHGARAGRHREPRCRGGRVAGWPEPSQCRSQAPADVALRELREPSWRAHGDEGDRDPAGDAGDPIQGEIDDRQGDQPDHAHDDEPERACRHEGDDADTDGHEEGEADQDLIDAAPRQSRGQRSRPWDRVAATRRPVARQRPRTAPSRR